MNFKNIILNAIGTLSPKLITRLMYYRTFHKRLDLKNPKTLNEKIQWLKLYGDTSQWPLLADKYRVREYVEQKGLGDILVKLYGHWDHIEDVEWDKLPNQFVLKVNNGCGDILICKDKTKLDIPTINKVYGNLLKKKFGVELGELHYQKIKPCIIVEELLDASKQNVVSSSLVDYKVWCLDGKPAYIFVYMDRQGCSAHSMVYDLDWNPHPEYMTDSKRYDIIKITIPRPLYLDKMLEVAEKLSAGNPQMRVDLYEVNGNIYFGELTMTAASGLMNHFTDEFLLKMGLMVHTPEAAYGGG